MHTRPTCFTHSDDDAIRLLDHTTRHRLRSWQNYVFLEGH